MEETLFDAGPGAVGAGSLGGRVDRGAPLAVRMRPRSLDDLVGQDQLLRPGSPLRLLVERREPAAVLLWGPPGSGKTTIAAILSADTGRRFVEVSAVSAGVKEVRAVVDEARRELGRGGSETVLFVDEIHRFSKAQQDALLPGVENRWVTLVAATTENPSFSVIPPLLSRCLLLTLEPLGDDGIRTVVARALAAEQGLGGAFELEPAALDQLVRLAAGDARRALGYLEAAARGASAGAGTSGPGRTDRSAAPGGAVTITAELLARVADSTLVRYDRAGDQHYDVISAFIKSVRGSDVDAALHYFARMVAAGEDPRFIARRLVILASEDIGLADPTALPTAVAAAQAVQLIGMPEARLNLGQAVIALALAPKSNAVITAVEAAMTDVRDGLAGLVPAALRDSHYPGSAGLGHGTGYRYAHDDPRGVVPQRYAPEGIAGRVYYRPTGHGTEAEYAARAARIRAILAEADGPD